MKLCISALFILLLISNNGIAQVTSLPAPGSMSVMGGEYVLSTNAWGEPGRGAGRLTIEADMSSTYFSVIHSTLDSSSVQAYPFLFKGSHFGGTRTTNSPIPMKVSEVSTAPFTWTIATNNAGGTWNCAYESWFNATGTGSNYLAELMVWINYAGGAGPAGSVVDTVNIGGYSWDLSFVPAGSPGWSQNYIAYKMRTPIDSITIDFNDIMHDALRRGYLRTSWYLCNMEAGFEIWRGGQGLTTYEFTADVAGGGTEENYPPASFILVRPYINVQVPSPKIGFAWQASVDPNSDSLEYIFHLSGPGVDTTIAGIRDDSLYFDGSTCLRSLSTYTWSVAATDGIDTTSSAPRTFRTKTITDITTDKQVPLEYSLEQNYPNPFNPAATIFFTLKDASPVTLKIIDVMGREVATLLQNERRTAGRHAVTFDATNLPSGVYFYRIQTGEFTQTHKMALIK